MEDKKIGLLDVAVNLKRIEFLLQQSLIVQMQTFALASGQEAETKELVSLALNKVDEAVKAYFESLPNA